MTRPNENANASQPTTSDGLSNRCTKLLGDLIESSRNLPSSGSDLGTITLSVNEIKRRARELRAMKKADSNHTKAHYLLANSGVSIQDVDYCLASLESRQLVEQHISKESDGDLDAYLRVKKNENILSSIEQSLMCAAKDFDVFVNQNFNFDWEKRKEEVRENFGILMKKHKSNSKTSSASSSSRSFPWGSSGRRILDGESKLNVNENYSVRKKFEKYAIIINSFNNARQADRSFNLPKEFLTQFSSSSDYSDRQIHESWKILDEVQSYNTVTVASRHYLERHFLSYVDDLYKKNLSEGLPTNANKVKSFIECKLKNPDNTWKHPNLTVVNGLPVWALIFYLLRAGLAKDALEVAIAHKLSFKKVEQSFLSYFKAYMASPNQNLPHELVTRLHTEYNQHIKNSLDGDPYRTAVYKIVGRCDLTRKNIPTIVLSIEDWLWVHLMLIKEEVSSDEPIYERYGLKDFQGLITSYGASRFQNNFLQVLLLSGLYEHAVEYAYTLSESDAVHLAIALASRNMISVSNYDASDAKSFVSLKGEKKELNFAMLIGNFTSSFKFTDPRIAVEYLILIAMNEDKDQVSLCHEALRELVLETKEFTILLGKVNRDGTRIPGVIEERQGLLRLSDEQEFLHRITEQAASKADEDGRTYDSLLLYQLADEYDTVICTVNKLLSGLLSNTDLDQPLLNLDDNSETNPVLIAKRIMGIYINNLEIAKTIRSKSKENCLLFLKLVDIRRVYLNEEWRRALELIEEVDLIPFADESSCRTKAQEFSTLHPEVLKVISNLLIITMSCISHIVDQLKRSDYPSVAKEEQSAALRKVAKNCMIYAGMIQYKMPRETYSILINFEVDI
ncbi:LAMI_0F13014g1_1 [Lachancea mirantina]|uniref:Nuclear pore protein n=1 Tax=Lachancea mirantina TaxID=1230905 RepID=A0A1G4K3I1_9SACH|nr:LAMI_0F13014g1_1 [Lachancea mirantina]